MNSEVKLQRIGDAGVVVLTLNAPERRNALTVEMANLISMTLTEIEGDESVRALVITGEGSAFCAGAALSTLRNADEEVLQKLYNSFLRVATSPLPTIAALNGATVGAGVNLALACDLRIATPRTKVDARFLRLGLHPGGGSTWMLSRLLGPQGASSLILFGEVLIGHRCRETGFAWEVVDDVRLVPRAIELAAKAAAVDPFLLRRAKETLRRASDISHNEAIQLELTHQLWSLDQPAWKHQFAVD
jgi:enoyl-CoA hydratase